MRPVREGAQFLEPDGGVDVVAQHDLARIHVSCKQALDAFLQQPFSKCRVAFGAGLRGLSEVTGDRHLSHLLLLAAPVLRVHERLQWAGFCAAAE